MQRQDYTQLKLRHEPPSSIDILRKTQQAEAQPLNQNSQPHSNQQQVAAQPTPQKQMLEGKSSRHTGSASSFVANLMARAGVVANQGTPVAQSQPRNFDKYAFDDIHPDFQRSQAGYPFANAANQQQQPDSNRRPGNQDSERIVMSEIQERNVEREHQERYAAVSEPIESTSPPKNLTPQRESASRNHAVYRSSSFHQGQSLPNEQVHGDSGETSSPFKALKMKKFSNQEGNGSLGENDQYELSSIPHVPQSATVGGLSQYYEHTARERQLEMPVARTSGISHLGLGSELFAEQLQEGGAIASHQRDTATVHQQNHQPAQNQMLVYEDSAFGNPAIRFNNAAGEGESPPTAYQAIEIQAAESSPSADLQRMEQMMQFHQILDQPMPSTQQQAQPPAENQYLAQLAAHRQENQNIPQEFNIYYEQIRMQEQGRLPTHYAPRVPHMPSQERMKNQMRTIDIQHGDNQQLQYNNQRSARYYSNERNPSNQFERNDEFNDIPMQQRPAKRQKPGLTLTSAGRGGRPRTGGPTPKSSKSMLYQGHTRSSAAKRISATRNSFHAPSNGRNFASPLPVQSPMNQIQSEQFIGAFSQDMAGTREHHGFIPTGTQHQTINPQSTSGSFPASVAQTLQSRKFSPAQSQRSGQRLYNNAKIVDARKARAQVEREEQLRSLMKQKPTICKKSKQIAEAKAQLETEEFYVGPMLTPAYARACLKASEAAGTGPARYRNHHGCYHNQKQDEEDAECTHKPRINKKSKSLIENMVADNIKKKNQLARGYQRAVAAGTLEQRDAVGKQMPTRSHGGQSSRSIKMGSFTNATISGAGDSLLNSVMRPSQGMVATGCSPNYPICWPATNKELVISDSIIQNNTNHATGVSQANRDLFTFQQNAIGGTHSSSQKQDPSPMRAQVKESQGTLRMQSTEKDVESRVQLNSRFRDLDQHRAMQIQMRPPSTDRADEQINKIPTIHNAKISLNQREYMMSPIEMSYQNNGGPSPRPSDMAEAGHMFTIGMVDQTAQQLPQSKQPFFGSAKEDKGPSLRERIDQRVAAEKSKDRNVIQKKTSAAKMQNEVIKLNAKQLEKVRESMRKQDVQNVFKDKKVRPRRNNDQNLNYSHHQEPSLNGQSFQSNADGKKIKKVLRNDAIYRKSMEWLSKIDKKLEEERTVKEEVEMKACSFTPNIVNSVKPHKENQLEGQVDFADYHLYRAEKAPQSYTDLAHQRAASSHSKGTVSTQIAAGPPQLRVEQRAISRATVNQTNNSGHPQTTKAVETFDKRSMFSGFDISRKSAASENKSRLHQPTVASRSKIVSPDVSGRLTPQNAARQSHSRQSVARTVKAVSSESPFGKNAARKMPNSFVRRPEPSHSPGKVSIGPMRTLSPRQSGTSQPPKPSGRQDKIFGNKKAKKLKAAKSHVKSMVSGIVDLRMSRVFGSTSKSSSIEHTAIQPFNRDMHGSNINNIVTTFGGQYQDDTYDHENQINKISSIGNLQTSHKSDITIELNKLNQWQGGISKIKEDSLDREVSARSIKRVGSQYMQKVPTHALSAEDRTPEHINQKHGDSDDLNLESIDDQSVFVNINGNQLMPFPDRTCLDRKPNTHNIYGTHSGDLSTDKQPTHFELFQQKMGKRIKYFNESETHSQSYAGNLGGQSQIPGFRFSEVRDFSEKLSKSPSNRGGNPHHVATPSDVELGIDSHRMSSVNLQIGNQGDAMRQRSSVGHGNALPDEFTLAKPIKRGAGPQKLIEPSDFSPTERSNPQDQLEGGISRQGHHKDSLMATNDWQYSQSQQMKSRASNPGRLSEQKQKEEEYNKDFAHNRDLELQAQQQHIADQILQAEEAIGLVHVNEVDEEDESRMSSAYLKRSQRSLKRTVESGLNNNGSRASYGFLKQVGDIEPSEYSGMVNSQGTRKGLPLLRTDQSQKNTIDLPINGVSQFYERQQQLQHDIEGYHSRQDRRQTIEDMTQGKQPSARDYTTSNSRLPPRRADLAVVAPSAFDPEGAAAATQSSNGIVRTTKNSQNTQPILTSLPPMSLLSNSLEFSNDRRSKHQQKQQSIKEPAPGELQEMSRELMRQNREVEQIRDEIRRLNQKQINQQ